MTYREPVAARDAARTPALLDRLERMERLLRGLEWRETDRDDDFFCVRCGERKSDGHAPDCELAALLRSG